MPTVDELLARARARLERLDPQQAAAALRAGAVLVDIRSDGQRARDGAVPGALVVARNVLEWRCDPASGYGDPRVAGRYDHPVIVMCDEGYQSSLAAVVLQDLGYRRATDLAGGFQAWRAAGLPVEPLQP